MSRGSHNRRRPLQCRQRRVAPRSLSSNSRHRSCDRPAATISTARRDTAPVVRRARSRQRNTASFGPMAVVARLHARGFGSLDGELVSPQRLRGRRCRALQRGRNRQRCEVGSQPGAGLIIQRLRDATHDRVVTRAAGEVAQLLLQIVRRLTRDPGPAIRYPLAVSPVTGLACNGLRRRRRLLFRRICATHCEENHCTQGTLPTEREHLFHADTSGPGFFRYLFFRASATQ